MNDWFGPRQKQSLFVLVLLAAGIGYYTCKSQPAGSPEAIVRGIVKTLIEAAEERDLEPFKTYLSDQVTDENGRTKDELLTILRGIFFTHKKISLTTLQIDITPNTNPNLMQAHIVVLMSETTLPTDRGEFFTTFRKEGDGWRITEVNWGEGYGID